MEDFILLIRGKNTTMGSPEQMQKSMKIYGKWMEKMMAEGRYKQGQPLDDSQGKLLKNKSQVLTDGPFMDSKEMISGYIIISAKDFAEAVELTKTCPLLENYQIEVRKIKQMM